MQESYLFHTFQDYCILVVDALERPFPARHLVVAHFPIDVVAIAHPEDDPIQVVHHSTPVSLTEDEKEGLAFLHVDFLALVQDLLDRPIHIRLDQVS